MNIPATLKSARASAGLSQMKLAALIGANMMTISNWERGVKTPRADAFLRVLAACGYAVRVERE